MNGGTVVVFGKAGGVCFGLSFGRSFTHHDILNIDSQIYGKRRPNVRCPHCLIVVRYQLPRKQITSMLDSDKFSS